MQAVFNAGHSEGLQHEPVELRKVVGYHDTEGERAERRLNSGTGGPPLTACRSSSWQSAS